MLSGNNGQTYFYSAFVIIFIIRFSFGFRCRLTVIKHQYITKPYKLCVMGRPVQYYFNNNIENQY